MRYFKLWLEQQENRILYVTRGISGSGKSTLARTLAPKENIFSTDDFFMVDGEYRFDPSKLSEYHNLNQRRVEEAMKSGVSPIVVDNTNTQAWEIKPYVAIADKYGYEVIIKESETPWRFDAKELANRNTHGVPEESIRRMISRYERDITLDDIRGSVNPFERNKVESFGGSALSPSSAEDQGEGELLIHRLEKPGAFPTYELPKKKTKKVKGPKSNL